MAPKRTGREACERPNMTIPASSEEISWLVGRAATMGSRKSAVKTILDCLRERLSFNGAIATAALLFRQTKWAAKDANPKDFPVGVLTVTSLLCSAAGLATRVGRLWKVQVGSIEPFHLANSVLLGQELLNVLAYLSPSVVGAGECEHVSQRDRKR